MMHNNQSMSYEDYETIAFIINLIELMENSFSFFISLTICILIVRHMCTNRLLSQEKLGFILCINIYIVLFLLMITRILIQVDVLKGDLYGYNPDSIFCRFLGYAVIVLACIFYYSFVNQAIYRLCRMVYPQYPCLRVCWLYILLPFIELILASLWYYPLLYWNDLVYISEEHYCYVPFRSVRGILWICLFASMVPTILLSIIYFRITKFLRRQSINTSLPLRRLFQRDLLIIKRILIIINLLTILALPGMILIVRRLITGEAHPLSIRITYLSIGSSTAGLSILLIFCIPQLKEMVSELWDSEPMVSTDQPLVG